MSYLRIKSRDNARTPMQWDDSENGGFTIGKPWIKVNSNYREINAKEQMKRADSVFAYYQKLIKLRREYDVIVYGSYELLLPEDAKVYAYIRTLENQELLVVCSFAGEETRAALPGRFRDATLLITNEGKPLWEGDTLVLSPYEAFACLIG